MCDNQNLRITKHSFSALAGCIFALTHVSHSASPGLPILGISTSLPAGKSSEFTAEHLEPREAQTLARHHTATQGSPSPRSQTSKCANKHVHATGRGEGGLAAVGRSVGDRGGTLCLVPAPLAPSRGLRACHRPPGLSLERGAHLSYLAEAGKVGRRESQALRSLGPDTQ